MVPTTCLSKKFKPSLGLELIDSQSSKSLVFMFDLSELAIWNTRNLFENLKYFFPQYFDNIFSVTHHLWTMFSECNSIFWNYIQISTFIILWLWRKTRILSGLGIYFPLFWTKLLAPFKLEDNLEIVFIFLWSTDNWQGNNRNNQDGEENHFVRIPNQSKSGYILS